MDTRPIGIFDSGSGGLSIWRSIISLLPHESTIYIGDHASIPYSTKTEKFIKKRVVMSIQFLLSKQVKMIVIACNTATVSGIEYFRKIFPDVPIVGVVPVVKTAASQSKVKKFGILSTELTAKSPYQQHLIASFASDCEVFSVGNTELVRMIENGQKDSRQMTELLETMLHPLIEKKIDVLVLGCTHFPFVRMAIQSIIGSNVLILDSGEAVGRHVKYILEHEEIQASTKIPTYQFFTTGDAQKVSEVASHLLESPIVVKKAPDSVQ